MSKKKLVADLGENKVLDWIKNTDQKPIEMGVKNKPIDATLMKRVVRDEPPLGWLRKTYIVRESHIDEIARLAFQLKKTQKDILDEALALYLKHQSE